MKGEPKRKMSKPEKKTDFDTLRPEYDFSKAKRGVTAARYAEGTNVALIDPDLLDVFPDGESVNKVLRALAPVLRAQRAAASRRKPA